MRILLITEFFPKTAHLDIHGGVEARVFFIAQYLAKKHTVFVIASNEKGKPKSQILEGVTVKRVGKSRNYTYSGDILERILFTLFAIGNGLFLEFDLVEGSGFFSYVPAFILGFIKKRKKIAWIPDTVATYSREFGKIWHTALSSTERYILTRQWDKLITISNTSQEKLSRLGVEKNTISTIYCGVNARDIRSIVVSNKKKFAISSVTRLVSYKNVADIITAASIVKGKYPSFKCDIVGTGPLFSELSTQIKNQKLTSVIQLHGFVSDHRKVIKIVKESTIFCSASQVEGFGIAIIEAFAAGVPAVLSDIETHKEITKQKGAVFFETGNPVSLANKILAVLDSKRLYQMLQKQAKRVALLYSWNVVAKETEELYASMCTN